MQQKTTKKKYKTNSNLYSWVTMILSEIVDRIIF